MGNPEIKNRVTGDIIVPTGKYANIKEAVEKSSANLSYADLSSADLRYADLRYADLRYANLRYANLSSANLSSADLRSADLSYADLRSADLRSANLSSANLSYADLSSANLNYADLSSSKNLILPDFQNIPEEGSFIAWKKCRNHLVKIVIPNDAKRTSCVINRKCRAEYVKTIAIYDLTGKIQPLDTEAFGLHSGIIYKVDTITKADSFDNNPLVDCTHGIHFFITKKEALEFSM